MDDAQSDTMTFSGDIERKQSQFYMDKMILAPMVRANNLPFRLLCLDYGASIVYSEELIDYKLSECRRLENKVLGTVDFVDPKGEVVLRTIPSERDNLVLQIGSNNPERALKAARLASRDIAGLDFNFGCPKSFSLSGGMGAALLDKPEQIKALLTKVVENIEVPVTCKIRLLPDIEQTISLVKMIEQCGVAAIAVHGRTKEQRPRHENQDDCLRAIADCIRIPMIANGGSNHIKNYADLLRFKETTKASSVMIARAAMKNPSIFKSDNVLEPIEKVIGEFIKLAVKYDNFIGNSKYSIQHMLSSGHFGQEFVEKFQTVSDYATLCDLFNLSDWYEQNKLIKDKNQFYDVDQLRDEDLEIFLRRKRELLGPNGIELICDNIPFHRKMYGSDSPKGQLMSHLNRLHKKIDVETFHLGAQSKHRYYSLITYDNRCYLNKAFSNSKKGAEQATAMLVCGHLKLTDLQEYKNKSGGSYRNVT